MHSKNVAMYRLLGGASFFICATCLIAACGRSSLSSIAFLLPFIVIVSECIVVPHAQEYCANNYEMLYQGSNNMREQISVQIVEKSGLL